MKNTYTKHESTKKSVREWHSEDQPREKLLLLGSKACTNSELLAILLQSGNSEQSVVSLAQEVWEKSLRSFTQLGRWNSKEWKAFKGIGDAKAAILLAAFEISRRKWDETPTLTRIESSQDAYNKMRSYLEDETQEVFYMLCLNQRNAVIDLFFAHKGGFTSSMVDIKTIARHALLHQAQGVILAHNHPSGNPKPSQADISLTRTCKEAFSLLDIRVLDHLIIYSGGYTSFADSGLLTS